MNSSNDTLATIGLCLTAIQFPFLWIPPLNAMCLFIVFQSIGFVRESFKEWSDELPAISYSTYKSPHKKSFVAVSPVIEKGRSEKI